MGAMAYLLAFSEACFSAVDIPRLSGCSFEDWFGFCSIVCYLNGGTDPERFLILD